MKKIVMIMLIIVLLTNVAYAASPPNTINDLFPDLSTLDIHSSQPKNFEKYVFTHYMFDTEKFKILESWATGLTTLVNSIFLFTVCVSQVVNYLLMACFKFNIFSLISNVFNMLVWAVRDAVFMPLLKPILTIVGIVIVFNAAIGKFTSAWRSFINVLIVFLIAFGFFSNPAFFIDSVNEFSEEISGEVLAKTASIATGSRLTADDAVVNLGNTFWESTVVKPWQLIQFGNIRTGEAEMDNYLKESWGSSTRKELANDMAKQNELFTASGSIIRFVMVLFIGVIVLILDLFVLVPAALCVMFQFAAIVSAIIMILAFILALLPNRSFKVALQGLSNTFGFLLAKIGLTILLSMYFALNVTIYRLSNTYGWLLITILQLLLIVSIVIFRQKIIGFVYSVASGQQAAIENIHKKGNMKQSIKNGLIGLYAGKKVYGDMAHMMSQRKDKKLTKKFTPMAKEFLAHRYTNEKRAAEANVRKNGGKVEYSNFVKQVDSRVDKGFTPFDEREVNRTVDMMKGLDRQGNNPENLLTTKIDGIDDNRIQFKQHDLEKSVEEEKYNLQLRQEGNKEKINNNIKADKNSKLYKTSAAVLAQTNQIDKQTAAILAEYPEAVINTTGGIDSIVLENRQISAIGELRKEKFEREFTDMKKEEYEDNIINVKEPQEIKKAVGSEMRVTRPVGAKTVERKYTKINKDTMTNEAITNTIENTEQIESENIKIITETEHKNIDNKNVTNNVTNRTETIDHVTETNKNVQFNQNNVNSNTINKKVENNGKTISKENIVHDKINKNNNTENKLEQVNHVTETNKNVQFNQNNTINNTINRKVENNEKTINKDNVVHNRIDRISNIENKLNKVNNIVENQKNKEVKSENIVNNNKNVTVEQNQNVINKENVVTEQKKIINNIINEKQIVNEEVSNIKSKKID